MQGYTYVRPSRREEHPTYYSVAEEKFVDQPNALPCRSSLGFSVLYNRAEDHFGHIG
ncbi:hypothetical protein [Hymenobacter cellulosivorans]|uniref:Uncharacterized protein n=1 Tax=Hymenobacter cellulosivorans TaxID=2932249 RepID=A0ABY4FA81_9BACT|nr:hypothetical protein [Hymenobacter cellulosivorans]UOQ53574.1 hypothetical protein MUN80_02175 [Hymenobacter cellulosivorans]